MDLEKEKAAFLGIYKYYPSAIKFTFDLKANGLGLIKLTENSQPSHLLIEEYEEVKKICRRERESVC